ncbi:hypothetical protein BH10BDE1_BH10BDE1_27890 [soil metagenome]
MNRKLNLKQGRFVEQYLVDLNATRAAVRAGYSEESARSIGAENLTKPDIQAAIEGAMDERSSRTKVDQDYVIAVIKETIERCSQAIPVLSWDATSQRYVETGEWRFEHMGVLKGCELLGRHLRLFTDGIELSRNDSLAETLAKARKRLAGE